MPLLLTGKTKMTNLNNNKTNKIQYATDPMELMLNWITHTDGCMLIKEDAPYLDYKGNPTGKPSIRSLKLDGDNCSRPHNSYSIQNYAWVAFGKNELKKKSGTWSTTCGNDLCMNPDHIVWTAPSTKPRKAPATTKATIINKGSVVKLKQYKEVCWMAMEGISTKDIANELNISEPTVNTHKRSMTQMFGGDFRFSDLVKMKHMMHALKRAEDKMTGSSDDNNNSLFDM